MKASTSLLFPNQGAVYTDWSCRKGSTCCCTVLVTVCI